MAAGKVKDFLRSLKVTYSAYNFLHASQLEHNKTPYKNVGLKKLLFRNISSKDFANMPPGDIPWMDKEISTEEIKKRLDASHFPEQTKNEILNWKENGYLILRNFFPEMTV